ncbi:MAG: 6-bladed beta-propeller [Balneolaceae bacterium]|nr:6-bladed beta-propeller [Balneolaceae bacterium]
MKKSPAAIFLWSITFLMSFSILSSCSSGTEDGDFSVDSLPILEMQQTVQFSESDEMLLSNISQLKVDSEGNIIIVDGRQRIIHAVDPSGNYIQQIGANGSGPGEYQFPGIVEIGPDDSIHLMDWASRTVISYSKENGQWAFESDFIAEADQTGFFSTMFPLGSGEYFISAGTMSANSEDQSLVFKKIGTDSNVLQDSIQVVPGNERFKIRSGDTAMMSLSQNEMHRQSVYAHDYNGSIYYGWSDSLAVFKLPSGSESFDLHADIDLENAPFTSASGDSILSRFESLLEGNSSARNDLISSFPDTKPIFSRMLADESGHLWIQLQLPEGNATWLILDPQGEPVYRAIFDEGMNLRAVRNGLAYVVIESELGVPAVRIMEFDYN